MNKISLNGVIFGGLTDVVLSNVLSVPLVMFIMLRLDIQNLPIDQSQAAVSAAIHGNLSFRVAQVAVGLFCSTLGGYVAAWIAKRNELLNAGLSSFLCLSIGVYAMSSAKESGSPVVHALAFVASPVFALLGGYLRIVRAGRRATVV